MESQTVPVINNLSLSYFIDLRNSHFKHQNIFEMNDQKNPWKTLPQISNYMTQFFNQNQVYYNKSQIVGSVHIDEKNIFIQQGTVIQHGAMIKSSCIIGKNCQIRKGAYLRGNVIIGDNVVIGNSCEIKNSIIMNECQIPHFNYVGDSLLGTKVHMSAGAITSNFRLDGKNINVSINEKQILNTGMQKFGAIIGDRSQVGCNVVLNPGSLIGKDCWIYPNISFRGFLQSKRILKLKQQLEICVKIQSKEKS